MLSMGQEGEENQNSESGKIPLTSVRHKNDGVLRDAHIQGHILELLQKAVPQLWLPTCKQKSEEKLRVPGFLASWTVSSEKCGKDWPINSPWHTIERWVSKRETGPTIGPGSLFRAIPIGFVWTSMTLESLSPGSFPFSW
jgi:hypothetical protein